MIPALLLSALLFGGPSQAASPPAGEATVLRTLEGKVVEVGATAGEGELPVVTLKLQTGEGGFQVVVAPAEILAGLGFKVAVGDQIRARVFLEPVSRLAYAQKLLNESRDLMVRLRTLRHEPLWDATGRWQGRSADAPSRRPAERPGRRRADRTTPERPPPSRPP